jgi:hypothetical protein
MPGPGNMLYIVSLFSAAMLPKKQCLSDSQGLKTAQFLELSPTCKLQTPSAKLNAKLKQS